MYQFSWLWVYDGGRVAWQDIEQRSTAQACAEDSLRFSPLMQKKIYIFCLSISGGFFHHQRIIVGNYRHSAVCHIRVYIENNFKPVLQLYHRENQQEKL